MILGKNQVNLQRIGRRNYHIFGPHRCFARCRGPRRAPDRFVCSPGNAAPSIASTVPWLFSCLCRPESNDLVCCTRSRRTAAYVVLAFWEPNSPGAVDCRFFSSSGRGCYSAPTSMGLIPGSFPKHLWMWHFLFFISRMLRHLCEFTLS